MTHRDKALLICEETCEATADMIRMIREGASVEQIRDMLDGYCARVAEIRARKETKA